MASAKLNLHREIFRKCGHLGLFEAKPTCVIHGLARYSFFCFRSKRVDRCVGVEHEEYLEAVDLTSYVGTIPIWLASYCSSSTSKGITVSCTFWIMKISTSWPSLFSFLCSDFVVTAYVTVYYYYHV